MRERGNSIENVLGEVAVRIDDRNAFARIDVAHGEIEKERALARAGFPDDPDVALPLVARKDNAAAVRGRRNWKRLCLHIVAPAPGDDALCLCSSRLPSCALPYLWRSGERGTPSDPW